MLRQECWTRLVIRLNGQSIRWYSLVTNAVGLEVGPKFGLRTNTVQKAAKKLFEKDQKVVELFEATSFTMCKAHCAYTV